MSKDESERAESRRRKFQFERIENEMEMNEAVRLAAVRSARLKSWKSISEICKYMGWTKDYDDYDSFHFLLKPWSQYFRREHVCLNRRLSTL